MSDERIESHDERVRILKEKADREGLDIPAEVLDYLADKAHLPQTLKSTLVQVFITAHRRGVALDIAFARRFFNDPELEPEPEAPQHALPHTLSSEAAAIEPAPAPAVEDAPAPVSVVEPAAESGAEPYWEPELEPVPEEYWDTQPEPEPEPASLESPAAPDPGPHAAATAPYSAPAPDALFDVVPVAAGYPEPAPATVWFAPMRSVKKKSLVTRAGALLDRAGLSSAVAENDLVAVKLHFGEEGNTGFVQPIFLREVVRRIREAGGRPFLTDANTLYRGQRSNAVDHLACAVHNGFSFATVDAPLIIADGLDGREACDVPIAGGAHFDSVRIGSAAVHADAMVVVTHVKGHEATGFGGALKNVGMGLGCRSAKQRMHADFRPEVTPESCTACGRCVQWCPVRAIAIAPDRVARVDYEVCYGCGECVAACPFGAIATQWKTTPEALQEKIVEHAAGALAEKAGKVVYLSFITNVSPDCDCWSFSDAPVVADIGVLASTDIAAIDQAAYDLVNKAAGLPGTRGDGMAEGADKFTAITGVDGTHAMRYAERMGLGTRRYELRTVE